MRDVRGVQVVVFSGGAGYPVSYLPIMCYSTGTQADIFIRLDSLQVDTEYLVNIDGYLEDHCAFTLALSSVSKGWPAFPESIG